MERYRRMFRGSHEIQQSGGNCHKEIKKDRKNIGIEHSKTFPKTVLNILITYFKTSEGDEVIESESEAKKENEKKVKWKERQRSKTLHGASGVACEDR